MKTVYYATIGIECHVQLKTKTKLFSAVDNDARNAEPNTLINHIDLGMPGALPVLNKRAVELAVRFAKAIDTKPQRQSYFERKHYFYPDLPKGYQITQLTRPIIKGGQVSCYVNGKQKTVRINRVQLEEDAGKSIHPLGQDHSLVDLNRAGTPLLEIVSEPDIHSAAEAKAYARELYLLVRYTDVSDANLYYGNMRFDVNVSVSTEQDKLGTRTETKNLNSFKSVEKAVEYEVKRQTELLMQGNTVVQETRGWSEAKQKTLAQRSKEEAHDYRYFPEPDIPPLELSERFIEEVQSTVPTLPNEWRARLGRLNLDSQYSEVLLDAEVESEGVSYLALIEQNLDNQDYAKHLANWFVNTEIPARRSDDGLSLVYNDEKRSTFYYAVYELLNAGKLNASSAKSLIIDVLSSGAQPSDLLSYAEQQGYVQIADENTMRHIVEKVIAQNPKVVADIKNGETKAIGYLVGQVMKASQGKANPQLAQELINQEISHQ